MISQPLPALTLCVDFTPCLYEQCCKHSTTDELRLECDSLNGVPSCQASDTQIIISSFPALAPWNKSSSRGSS
jgi:hypothetical protein